MKTIIHKANDRGFANHGWLKSAHSFSFAGYYNPEKTRFGLLRVLNDDEIAPGTGFGEHPHDNMEIISIPLEGALEHKDSMGNGSVISAGEVQLMSAGIGITHSEFNASQTEAGKFLQIWIFPKYKDITPYYEQKKFKPEDRKNKFQIVVSPDNKEALKINQDAYLSMGNFDAGTNATYNINGKTSGVYIFIISGKIKVAGETLEKRDAMGIWETDTINFEAIEESEVLTIEVPMSL
jgi:quercetin 2,3-dioxygenase